MKDSKTKRIFIVGDDTIWTSFLKRRLNELGYKRVYNFNDGKNCLKHFYLQPDLVFLNHQMEEMDGIEVLKQIKKQSGETGVVFCTGKEDLKTALNAMQLGSIDYLFKGHTYKKEVAAILAGRS